MIVGIGELSMIFIFAHVGPSYSILTGLQKYSMCALKYGIIV
jgi:hypothetical protein